MVSLQTIDRQVHPVRWNYSGTEDTASRSHKLQEWRYLWRCHIDRLASCRLRQDEIWKWQRIRRRLESRLNAWPRDIQVEEGGSTISRISGYGNQLMQDSMKMGRRMALVSSHMEMDVSMRENGLTVSSMEKERSVKMEKWYLKATGPVEHHSEHQKLSKTPEVSVHLICLFPNTISRMLGHPNSQMSGHQLPNSSHRTLQCLIWTQRIHNYFRNLKSLLPTERPICMPMGWINCLWTQMEIYWKLPKSRIRVSTYEQFDNRLINLRLIIIINFSNNY